MLRIVVLALFTLLMGSITLGTIARAPSSARVTDIGEIAASPGKFNGKRVTVRGTVVQAVGVLGHGGFRIRQHGSEAEILVAYRLKRRK